MPKSSINSGLLFFTYLLFSGLPGLSMGQSSVLEEVVVTAQKREQSAQDVGISITAFNSRQMKAFGFEESKDIARMTPAVTLSGGNGGQTRLFNIRGVGQNDFNDQAEPPIAVYIDEGYTAWGQGQKFALFDLERVEVLRGPQGTLFGRNATGGLIHYISRKPTREFEGFADVTYGSHNQVRVEAAAGGPMSDTMAARVSVLYNRHDPILENNYPNGFVTLSGNPLTEGGEDTYNDDTVAVRAHLLFEPNEDVEILLTGAYARSRPNSAPYLERGSVAIRDAAGRLVNVILASPTETCEEIGPGGVCLDSGFSFDADTVRPAGGNLHAPTCTAQQVDDLSCSADFAFKNFAKIETVNVIAKLTWEFENFTLTSVSDYKDFSRFIGLDGDSGPVDLINVLHDSKGKTFSQEIRLHGEFDRTRWVTGLYYLYDDRSPKNAIVIDSESLWLPLFGVPVGDTNVSEFGSDSYSVFGQFEYDLSDTFTLIAGARVIREEKDFTSEETVFLNTNRKTLDTETVLFSFRPQFTAKLDATLWSGKVQLEWKPNEDWLVYAGVNRGVKAGGFNSPFTFGGAFAGADVPYTEEILLAYETGFKAQVFNGTTRLNGSVFYYDYTDYQGFVFGGATSFLTNIDAEFHGFEVELFSSPLEGWDVMLSLAYLDTDIPNLEFAPGLFKDVEAPWASKWQAAGMVRYQWPSEVFGGNVAAQMDFNYLSSYFVEIRSFDVSKLDGYVVGNARLSWTSADEKIEASFFINNIADDSHTLIGFDLATLVGSTEFIQDKGRWFGASVRYNF